MSQLYQLESTLLRGQPVIFSQDATDDLRTVPAKLIEEAVLKSKKVEIWNAVISGQLRLTNRQISQEIRLVRCTLSGSDFSFSTFESGLTLSGTSFSGPVNFRSAVFNHGVRLSSTHFGGKQNTFYNIQVKGNFLARRAHFSGIADFADARFGPDVDFTGAVFEDSSFNSAKIDGSGHFVEATFTGAVEFSNIAAEHDLEFDYSQFNSAENTAWFDGLKVGGDLVCRSAVFAGDTRFVGGHVCGGATFERTQFRNDASFESMKVDSDLILEDAILTGKANFVAMKIEGTGIFRRARFLSARKTRFDISHFADGVIFQGVYFRGKVDFLNVHIGLNARFNGAVFDDVARFEAAKFMGLAEFKSGEWDNIIYLGPVCTNLTFDHARFEQDACFDDAVFNGNVSFRDTAFRAIYFSESGEVIHHSQRKEQFQGEIDLRGCTYNQIQANWESLLNFGRVSESRFDRFIRRRITFWKPIRYRQQPYNRQPYKQLESFFSASGQPEIADEIYLERRRIERKQKRHKNLLRWLADLLFYAGLARYGVRPLRLIVLSVILLVAGTSYFSHPHAARAKEKDAPPPYALSHLQAFQLSLHQFLPVEIPMGDQWVPAPEASEDTLEIRPSTFATILLKLPGWILVPLGLAALTGLLRRADTPKLSKGE